MNKKSLEDKIAECRGSKVFEASELKFNKEDLLIINLIYIVSMGSSNIENSLVIRLIITKAGILTLTKFQGYLERIITGNITPIFCQNVSFPFFTYRLGSEETNLRILLGNMIGKIEEISSPETLEMEVSLSSGRKQKLKLMGLSRYMMRWNKENSVYIDLYIDGLLLLNILIQNTLSFLEVEFKVRGFHYGTRHRNLEEFMIIKLY
jgi:hypothetical protein